MPGSAMFRRSPVRIFALLASIWLILVSFLMLASFEHESQSAYDRLQYKTEVSGLQFARHWASLRLEPIEVQQEYLNNFRKRFRPLLNFTVISPNGQMQVSTLDNLTQLSYSPVLRQIKKRLSDNQHCLLTLNNLQAESVNACGFQEPETQDYFISSLSQSDFLAYWLEHSGYFILTGLMGLIVFSLLFLLLSRVQRQNMLKQELLTNKFEKQGNDFRRLISNLPGLVYRLRMSDKSLDFVSPGSLQLLGYPPEYFTQHNMTPFDLIEDDDQHHISKLSQANHFSLKPFEMVYRVNTLNGESKWVLDRGRCYQDASGEHFIEGVILDITERELVRQQIEYLAVQDPLTELFNRYKFNDELVNAVDESRSKNDKFAMMFIDLDRFKNINDSLGHQLGDRLLRKVAARLQNILSEDNFLARMGGDEFVVLMRRYRHINQVEDLANKINRALRRPFNIDSYQLRTSCSIGISLCPDHSEHSHILWRYSDTAMYQVKARGGDGYQFFTEEMGDVVQHRIKIEHSFVSALENKEFELYYQPQVNIQTGELVGAEALIRWNHPELGFISPVEFIPIAEETGFIHDLGEWIFHEAMQELARWQDIKPHVRMAVNVSALQITQDFPEKLTHILQHHDIKPDSLELEITESLLMENIDYVQPLLNRIRDHGIHFAIDDFGTGYSSLSYLRYLPINKLKIDRAFVMNLEHNDDDVAMVKAIIAMGKNLNLNILAEGVENQEQLDILKEQGCGSFQGYLFSKPVDKKSFFDLYMKQ